MLNCIAHIILRLSQHNYDLIADEFSATRSFSWTEWTFFQRYFKTGHRILDLGCGNGRFFSFLESFKVEYRGVDISEKLIQKAKAQFPHGKFVTGSMLDLPFKNGFFEVVCSIASLHHMPSKKYQMQAIREAQRVLKNKGIFILMVWNMFQPKFVKSFKKARIRSLLSFDFFSSKDLFIPWGVDKKVKRYYYAFEPEELKSLLMKAGFEIVDIFGARKGEKVPFCDAFNLCFVCRKI